MAVRPTVLLFLKQRIFESNYSLVLRRQHIALWRNKMFFFPGKNALVRPDDNARADHKNFSQKFLQGMAYKALVFSSHLSLQPDKP